MKLNRKTVCQQEGPSLSAVSSDRRGGVGFSSKLCFQPFFPPSEPRCPTQRAPVFQLKAVLWSALAASLVFAEDPVSAEIIILFLTSIVTVQFFLCIYNLFPLQLGVIILPEPEIGILGSFGWSGELLSAYSTERLELGKKVCLFLLCILTHPSLSLPVVWRMAFNQLYQRAVADEFELWNDTDYGLPCNLLKPCKYSFYFTFF